MPLLRVSCGQEAMAMGAIFNIMAYSAGSFVLGITFTLVGVVLMFFIVKSWRRGGRFGLRSYSVGVVLFFFLAYQSVLLCGAVTIKSYCSDVQQAICAMVSDKPDNVVFSRSDSQQILDNISRQWPLVGYYVNTADFTGHTPADIAASMTDELRSFMNWFLVRRVVWSLLFIVIGAIAVIKTMHDSAHISHTQRSPQPTSIRRIYDD